jgi:hypothetical protein
MSVLWIRAQAPIGDEALVAQNAAAGAAIIQAQPDTSEPESYVVPASVERTTIVPTAELANYVVAHSEYSAPMSRRNLISALIASESGTGSVVDESDDANVVEDRELNVEKAK